MHLPSSILRLCLFAGTCATLSAQLPQVIQDSFDGAKTDTPLKGRKTVAGEVAWQAVGTLTITPAGKLVAGGSGGGTACVRIPTPTETVTLSADVDTSKAGFIALAFMERGDLGFWKDAALWVAVYQNGKIELRAKNMEHLLHEVPPGQLWKTGVANKVELSYDPRDNTTTLRINGAPVIERKVLPVKLQMAYGGIRFQPPLDGTTASVDNFEVLTSNGVVVPEAKAAAPERKTQINYPEPSAPIDALIGNPIWEGDTVTNEPVVFIDAGDGRPVAKLLFEPAEILSIRSSDLKQEFKSGSDVIAPQAGSRELSLPPGSAVPSLKQEELFPAPGSLNSIKAARGPRAEKVGAGRFLRFSENTQAFYVKQVLVTYRHKARWQGAVPVVAESELQRTLAKLKAKEPVTIAVLGDSISAGGNASVRLRVAPMLPPYDHLVVHELRKAYGGEVTVLNFSKGGQVSEWGIGQIPYVMSHKPDLVIIAFGMNDGSARIEATRFGKNHTRMIDAIRKESPATDVILVSPMWGNPEWTASAPDLYPLYRDTLEKLKSPGVALADVTTPFGEALALKSYTDLTVNGVNHPNDFGHRIYAGVISGLLIKAQR